MTVMTPTALRQPFLCSRQHHPRRTVAGIGAAEAHQLGQVKLVAEDWNQGSIWLIAQGKHK
jgi:hypothetical protein